MNPTIVKASPSPIVLDEIKHNDLLLREQRALSEESSHSLNRCAIDCITTIPKVTTIKKVYIDHILQISSIDLFRNNDFQISLLERENTGVDIFGISPPSSDILSSIFKRE